MNLRQREVQPDGEQQEHDAELGDDMDRGLILDQAQGMWAHQRACKQVSKTRRNVGALKGAHDQHRRGQQQKNFNEGRHEITACRPAAAASIDASLMTLGRAASVSHQ
jgi:hypothetical protein